MKSRHEPFGFESLPNRTTVQPMEGFDAESDGSPNELTFRRYQRYGRQGSTSGEKAINTGC